MQRGFVGILLVGCMLSLTLASGVGIIVKTEYPDHGVLVRVRDATSADVIESLTLRTDAKGEAGTQYETGRSKLLFTIMLVKDGNVVQRKDFPNQLTSETITLWMYSPPPAPVVNVTNTTVVNESIPSPANITITNTSTSPENKTSSFSTIIGKVSDSLADLTGRDYLIGVGFLVALTIIYWLYHARETVLGRFRTAQDVLQTHASSVRTRLASRPEPVLSERSLRTLQSELHSLKHQRLKEARTRFDEAKEELRRAEDDL